MMLMKKATLILAAASLLWLNACQRPQPRQTGVGPGDPNTPAGKAGKLAYKVEKETERVAKEAGKKIDQAARDAHAGYSDAEQKPDK